MKIPCSFIQTMMFEFHKNQAEALQIFYEVQDSIRMNFPGGRNHFPALSAWLLFLLTEAGGGYEKRDPSSGLHDQVLGL